MTSETTPLPGRLLRDPRIRWSSGIVAALVVAAILAPVLAPYDPSRQLDIVAMARLSPSVAHPMGTDQASRDVLSRVLFAGRVSIGVAVVAVLLSASVGTLYGMIAGYLGGAVDAVLMRLLDGLLAIPRVLLLIAALAVSPRIPIPLLVLLIGFTGWFGLSRLVRAEVLAMRSRDFVVAARALGASRRRILIRHLLPNVAGPVIVSATTSMPVSRWSSPCFLAHAGYDHTSRYSSRYAGSCFK